MKEVEVKILEVDKPALVAKLQRLGAKKIFDNDMSTVFFDKDNQLNRQKKLLRLRSYGAANKITFKHTTEQGETRIAEELEVEVDDFGKAQAFFERLGFVATKTGTKHRESYRLGNVRFDFDFWPGIPCYLEIESDNSLSVLDACKRLEIPHDRVKNWTGKQLLNHYGKKGLLPGDD